MMSLDVGSFACPADVVRRCAGIAVDIGINNTSALFLASQTGHVNNNVLLIIAYDCIHNGNML